MRRRGFLVRSRSRRRRDPVHRQGQRYRAAMREDHPLDQTAEDLDALTRLEANAGQMRAKEFISLGRQAA